jgi:diguanylate cyclase (GGDEF)-like protein
MPEAGIPSPAAIAIAPQVFAAYGALVAAGMLSVLYLYRGRAFVVYWIGSWVLIAGSLLLLGRGYADAQLGGVMLGLAQLLRVWSAGLMLLAGEAFPEAPLRWDRTLRLAAAAAVWFLAAPFLLPLSFVLSSGPAVAALLFSWSAVRYFALMRRSRYVGAFVVAAGLVLIAFGNAAQAGAVLNIGLGDDVLNRVIGFNMVVYMFVALGMHVLVFEDMTDELRRANRDLADANEEVKRLAITDPLTGCHNRRFFEEIERREMQRHARYGTPISIVFVDVNRFKQLNDTHGHDVGDAVLRFLGAMLRRLVRRSDYVIRWGGDEFVLLLTCGIAEAELKAKELKLAFDRELPAAGLPAGVGLSVGVASVTREAEGLAETIRAADSRMYRDKAARPPEIELL